LARRTPNPGPDTLTGTKTDADGPSPGSTVEPAVAETVLDLAPDAILVVDADGAISSANLRAREVFGHDDLTLLTVGDLVPPAVRNLHASHRAAYAREPRTRTMGSGLDLRAVRADGTTFPVEVALAPIALGDGAPGVVAIVRDVTERDEVERRINEIQETLDAAQEAVFIVDADTLALDYANQGAADQLGYSRDELLGLTALDLNPAWGESEFRDLIQPLLAGRTSGLRLATLHRRKDGSDLEVEAVLQPSTVARLDGRRRLVVFSRDMTERLETERQLQAAEQELNLLEERERIARDLHDTVIQRLFAAGMTLQATAAGADGPTGERVEGVIGQLDETIREIRQAIFRLTAHNLDSASVRRRVVEVIEQEQDALDLTPELMFAGPVETVSDDIVEHLISTLRESLSNIARHARAGSVRVRIEVTPGEVLLVVDDDGVGFTGDGEAEGNGLRNMRDRATVLGGASGLTPCSPHGTRLTWRVPRP
jgi:two-component system sensor histidine kinase DevS